MIWGDNEYYITGGLTLYLIGLFYSTYHKIQYVEGAKPNLIYFSTANDRSNDLPSILGPLFYIGFSALLLFMDSDFLGSYGVYYLIGYTIISIWSSFYGKVPSASFSIDKEDNILEYDDDGDHNDEIPTTDIQSITISPESITLETEQKKINLIHLSLDEKEIKLIFNFFRNQLHITPTLLSKEDAVTLQ